MNHVRGASQLAEAIAKWNGNDSTFPRGTWGDTQGGNSFTDEQAALLERISKSRRLVNAGWWTTWHNCQQWTLISTKETTQEDVELYEEARASL